MKQFALVLALGLSAATATATAAENVAEFACKEGATQLEVKGFVTQSKDEPWRFFMNLQTSTGVQKVFESRMGQGYDYGTGESIYGFRHATKSGYVIYEEISKAGKTRRVLTIKKKVITGDDKPHTLKCTAN